MLSIGRASAPPGAVQSSGPGLLAAAGLAADARAGARHGHRHRDQQGDRKAGESRPRRPAPGIAVRGRAPPEHQRSVERIITGTVSLPSIS